MTWGLQVCVVLLALSQGDMGWSAMQRVCLLLVKVDVQQESCVSSRLLHGRLALHSP